MGTEMKKLVTLVFCAAAIGWAQGPRRAPGFSLPDGRMAEHDLADYRGKIVLLEFMQTTCPHCAAFADVLKEAEQRYGGKIQILAVVKAPEDNGGTVAQYIAGHKVDYPILFDTGQMMYSYVLSGTMQFPHLYIIDGNGFILRDYSYGLTTRDIFQGQGLLTELDRILAKR